MSTVQKAYDPHEDRFCAIKRMKSSHDDMRRKASFNREYAALSELSHPHIVSLFDAGTDDDGYYMVLEWMPHNLVDWIQKKGALPWTEFYTSIGRPVLEALIFAQSRSWTHRDIKPVNILISQDGVPKIADYGIAKHLDKPTQDMTFAHFRSVPFTPPEDDAGELRYSRDCFSWAAVAVYCLTAKMPTDYGLLDDLAANLDQEVTPVTILNSALSRSPKERPPLASVLLAELDAFESDRRAALESRATCYLQFEPACREFLIRSLELPDPTTIEAGLLEELNEVQVGFRRMQFPDGTQGLRIIGLTWTLDTVRTPSGGRLMIRRALQLRSAEIDRYREGAYQPALSLTFTLPSDPLAASQALDLILFELDAFEAEAAAKAIDARRERIFRLWYAFLRSKADFEARRENAITFIDTKVSGNIVVLSTDPPASIETVGQSRVIRLISGAHIFCDIVDVNLDEVIVRVTSGDLGRLPRRGKLELNTVAAEKAIERQRTALDAINYDRSASPRLKSVIVDPAVTRAPVVVLAPRVPGEFDPEKNDVLTRALGLQDIFAIQGPPGTGKTRLIEEIIVQYLDRQPNHRVLVSSQTHVALDNVIERVLSRQPEIDIVRIGRLDDPKISDKCRDLVLDRKAQEWSQRVSERARSYMNRWAKHKNLNRSSIELGMMAERLIRLLGQQRIVTQALGEAEARVRGVEKRADEKLTQTGSAESSEIETDAVEAQGAAGELRNTLTTLRTKIGELRDRLRAVGGYGVDLADQTEEAELSEWSSMLLGDGEDEIRCRALLELQEDWLLRVGRSSDFHAAMLASAQIVAGTCIGMAGIRGMNQVTYDLCIVDEASKATATEILVPMSRSRKWILVGDPAQLPPFFEDESITRIEAFDDEEVRRTLLDRFLGGLPEHSVARLKNQYRMVKPIGDLISECFYNGTLVSPKIKPDVTLPGAFPKPVTWISTSNLADAHEIRVGASYRNDAECRMIKDALASINFIAQRRKKEYDVALIAGYVAQVKALQDAIRDRVSDWTGLRISCSTVDSFQGSQAEICIYSITRSNRDRKLGFLREKPRLNVALSRGRSALVIVGDDAFCRTAEGENHFRAVLHHIEAHPQECEWRVA